MSAAPSRSGTVVELVGLPGSGKSTIAAALHAALVGSGTTCTLVDHPVSADTAFALRASRRLVAGAAEALANPAAARAVVTAVARSGQESSRDALAGALQWLVVRRLVRKSRRSPGVHLLEEGPVQTLWTLGLRCGDPGALSRLSPGDTDLLVVVDCPLDEAVRRLTARTSRHSRSQRLTEPARSAELERGQRLLEDLLQRRGGAQLRVANTGDARPEDVARQAAAWVAAALPSARSASATPAGSPPAGSSPA